MVCGLVVVGTSSMQNWCGDLLTLFSNDPTTKFPIENLLISIAIPTQPGGRSDGRVPTCAGMIVWIVPSVGAPILPVIN